MDTIYFEINSKPSIDSLYFPVGIVAEVLLGVTILEVFMAYLALLSS